MKITVDSKSFVEAIQWSVKSYDSKDDKAYVALVVKDDGSGHLSHANPTSFMKSVFTVLNTDLDDESEMKLALDARYLQRLAKSLEWTGPIDLDYTTGVLTMIGKSGKFTIPTLSAKISEEPEFVNLGEVSGKEYFDSLQRLAKLCDPASAGLMPVLGTVDVILDNDDSKITMMATDRYTLGEIKVDFTPSADGDEFFEKHEHVLLPYESAVLIPANQSDADQSTLIYDDNSGKFGYSFSNGSVALFSLKATDPLDYTKLKTNAFEEVENTVSLQTKDLQKAINSISGLAWDEETIWFEISDSKFIVRDSNKTNLLEVESTIKVDDEQVVKFVRSVIGKIFSVVSTSKMNLRWGSETGAFVFESVTDDDKIVDNVFTLAIPTS